MENEFINYLKTKALSKTSIQRSIVIINMFWKWLDKENLEAENVSYNDLMQYIKYKKDRGISQATMQKYIGTIKHFYDHLIREKQINENPTIDIEIKGVKRKSLYHILDTT